MKWKITDCGRSTSGLKEKNDCTVRVLAAVLCLDYRTAHGLLAKAGRKDGHGFRFREPEVFALGLEALPEYSCKTWRSVSKELPTLGSFVIRVRGHVFAVVDGVVHDTGAPVMSQHVKMVYGLRTTE